VRGGTAVAVVVVSVAAALAIAMSRHGQNQGARCGRGFVPRRARCVPESGECPAPLTLSRRGCEAPDTRVAVPASAIALGPSDWEIEGTDPPRMIEVQAFRLDAFEVTRGRWADATGEEAARAASGMTRDEAEAFCAARDGRLPTEDEWIVAAASAASPPPRYPWGDTGVVCRRAAWGLLAGPCAVAADGPDTVGAHPDGDSPLGLRDLAGNVAEWVARDPTQRSGSGIGIAKGGSWQSGLATDLRIWARLELRPDAHDPRVGLRCAYPP